MGSMVRWNHRCYLSRLFSNGLRRISEIPPGKNQFSKPSLQSSDFHSWKMSSMAKRVRLRNAQPQHEATDGMLCDDVLVEIFNYLDVDDLRSVALECKQWNESIGSSAAAMRKFKLDLGKRKLSSTHQSRRNHQNIELDMFDDGRKSLGILDRFISLANVKCFKINASESAINAGKLSSVLAQMPLIQELSIFCSEPFSGQFSPKVDLPKLTTIILKSYDERIFKSITARNLTSIDLI